MYNQCLKIFEMNLFLRKNVFRTFDFVANPIIKKMKK